MHCGKDIPTKRRKVHTERCYRKHVLRPGKPKVYHFTVKEKQDILRAIEECVARGGTEEQYINARNDLNTERVKNFRSTMAKYADRDLTNADLASKSLGSGRPIKAIPKDGKVHKSLWAFMEEHRGRKRDAFFTGEKPSSEELFARESLDADLVTSDGRRMYVNYDDLVDYISVELEDEYNSVPEEKEVDGVRVGVDRDRIWYTRVRRWCIRNGISLRRVNKCVVEDPEKLAREILTCRERVEKAMRKTKATAADVANIDETAVRLFALMILTLHWRGAKSVPGAKRSKLCLSMPVVWWGNGDMDFIVVWSSRNKRDKKEPRWQNHGGVLFYRADTKWSTKKTYYKVMRALLTLDRKVKVFIDDYAPGHGGACPDEFVATLGGQRVRVPRGATWVLQPADRPQTNGKLKQLLRKLIRKSNIRSNLKKEFKQHGSLTEEARNDIGKILSEVREEFKKEKLKKGVAKAFQETVLPNHPMHSELRRLLEDAVPAAPKKKLAQGKPRMECPRKCGESWAGHSKKVLKNHEKECWRNRPELYSPVRKATESSLNKTQEAGLVAIVTNMKGKRQLYYLGESCVWNTKTWRKVKKTHKWWNKAKRIRYREATKKEKKKAASLS